MKKQMRVFSFLLALCMMLCVCGCSGENGEEKTPVDTTPETTQSAPVTEPSQTTAPQQASGYVVNVVDENGTPIAGAVVQLCKDNCYPSTTDANGRAVFELSEDTYKVSFIILPAGYTYSSDVQEFYFEDGSFEMTIVLKAAA